MDKKKRLVFNYFDTIYSGYKKSGSRPIYMGTPHVLFSYKNNDGRVAFEFNTKTNVLNFDNKDFYIATSMLGLSTSDMAEICKEYAADKLNKPSVLNAIFYNTRKNR
jgi:hypothetical protein